MTTPHLMYTNDMYFSSAYVLLGVACSSQKPHKGTEPTTRAHAHCVKFHEVVAWRHAKANYPQIRVLSHSKECWSINKKRVVVRSMVDVSKAILGFILFLLLLGLLFTVLLLFLLLLFLLFPFFLLTLFFFLLLFVLLPFINDL